MKKLLLILGIGLLSLTGCCNQVEDNLEMTHQHEWYFKDYFVTSHKIRQISYGYYDLRYEASVGYVNNYYCKTCNGIKHESKLDSNVFNTYNEAADFISEYLRNSR